MKTVALLSGGKDSVYNLLHCIIHGHQPVAVASLGPPEGKDELDSHMYQTVGHSGLATVAAALELPFFSHTINGTALNLGGEYGSREGKGKGRGPDEEKKDETEDLYELLRRVKEAMPEVQAVAAGAILSNYQRVRVEHVCSRLGLTPLAYLWERDQRELLGEMVDSGMESVLVKVAGAGLTVDHLGKTLAEMQPTLHRLNARYQLHICGEGGEYETFTVDCPLYKRKVLFDKVTTIVTDPNPFSTIAHLHLDSVSLGPPKPDVPAHETFGELRARILEKVKVGQPSPLEERVEGWKEAGEEEERKEVCAEKEEEELQGKGDGSEEGTEESACVTQDGWVYFGEVMAADASAGEGEIEDEVRACFARLEALLDRRSASLLSLTHLTVLLSPPSTMNLFPRINAIYSSYFGVSPPTRACVAVAGGEEGSGRKWRVKLEGVARVKKEGTEEERKALHVQSLSYWGAANIGPYSQSVKTADRLYIAGQIPLIPASLTLPSSSSFPHSSSTTSFSHHASLSLQHFYRIARASLPTLSSSSFSSYENSSSPRPEGSICWLSPSISSTFLRRTQTAAAVWRVAEKDYLEGIGEDEERSSPFLAVEAGTLPKGAEVEWQATWGVPPSPVEDDDEDDDAEHRGASSDSETWAAVSTVSNATGKPVTWQCSAAFPSTSSLPLSVFGVLGCSIDETAPVPLPGVNPLELHSIRVFYRTSLPPSSVRILATSLFSPLSPSSEGKSPAVSYIPVGKIATLLPQEIGSDATLHDVAFVLVGAPQGP
ncbi:hypothetical protein JCM11641_007139 [Rhodosporidiobolus odoratus]